MLLQTDLPTRAELGRLLDAQDPSSVSIYVPTEPASAGDAERIAFRNLSAEAIRQLRDGGAPRADVTAIEESLVALDLEEEFWRHQARSLAVLATPGSIARSGSRTGCRRSSRCPTASTSSPCCARRRSRRSRSCWRSRRDRCA